MTVNEAIQEFEDEAYHHSLHPTISDEAKAKALQALREKSAREKPEPLTLDELVTAYLEICGEDDCAGDSSVGIPPCQFFEAPDWDDVEEKQIPGGCKLNIYRSKRKDKKA